MPTYENPPPPPPETETKPIKSVASRTPRWARHCSATWHFTVAKITQSDAFNYMSYHFLCKRGIRPARTEQFLVILLPCCSEQLLILWPSFQDISMKLAGHVGHGPNSSYPDIWKSPRKRWPKFIHTMILGYPGWRSFGKKNSSDLWPDLDIGQRSSNA